MQSMLFKHTVHGSFGRYTVHVRLDAKMKVDPDQKDALFHLMVVLSVPGKHWSHIPFLRICVHL